MAEVEFPWALDGYCARYGFLAQPEGLTMREAARVFQLDPQPPEAGTLNDYITAALRERNLDYFSFFLHHGKPAQWPHFSVSDAGGIGTL